MREFGLRMGPAARLTPGPLPASMGLMYMPSGPLDALARGVCDGSGLRLRERPSFVFLLFRLDLGSFNPR